MYRQYLYVVYKYGQNVIEYAMYSDMIYVLSTNSRNMHHNTSNVGIAYNHSFILVT